MFSIKFGMDNVAFEPQETCAICDRVRWGNYQYLSKGQWRHAECYPGSESWVEYYTQLPKEKRTDAGNLLLMNAV